MPRLCSNIRQSIIFKLWKCSREYGTLAYCYKNILYYILPALPQEYILVSYSNFLQQNDNYMGRGGCIACWEYCYCTCYSFELPFSAKFMQTIQQMAVFQQSNFRHLSIALKIQWQFVCDCISCTCGEMAHSHLSYFYLFQWMFQFWYCRGYCWWIRSLLYFSNWICEDPTAVRCSCHCPKI